MLESLDTTFILGLLAAFVLGLSKAGLKGLGTVAVGIAVMAWDARASTGILLPLLCFADVIAVVYFRKYVKWDYLRKFLPAAFIGVILATFVGKDLPDLYFKYSMGIIILLGLAWIIYREYATMPSMPNNWPFSGSLGIATGFATMIGNLAGAFTNIFFLAMKMDKLSMIGTIAIFFFITNLFKVPFHIWVWETISMDTFMLNLKLSPAIVLGFIVGAKIVTYFSESFYRYFLIVMTGLGALLIFL